MALDGQLLAETEVTARWSNGYPMGYADGHCRVSVGNGKSSKLSEEFAIAL